MPVMSVGPFWLAGGLPVAQQVHGLGHHVGEGVHELGGLGFLVVAEDGGHDDDEDQHGAEVEVVPPLQPKKKSTPPKSSRRTMRRALAGT